MAIRASNTSGTRGVAIGPPKNVVGKGQRGTELLDEVSLRSRDGCSGVNATDERRKKDGQDKMSPRIHSAKSHDRVLARKQEE